MSDLHLDAGRPDLTAIFLGFLRRAGGQVRELFLLGDIFEAWIGDDDDAPWLDAVVDGLRRAGDAGVRIHFQHGNRDFLLGEAFAARAGLALLPEILALELGGVPTALCHGDALCTDDVGYQAFRRQSRDPAWQAQVLATPLQSRRSLARQLRQDSIEGQQRILEQGGELADVNEAAAQACLRDAAAVRLIHGHTHRPAVHRVAVGPSAVGERIVLADWRSAGEVLEVRPDGSYRRHLLTD
ncbi:MAG: UDP-2,3-diacylglucosamine diphosphatase [Xanthomonadaceae bacterium]|nr:UDP-2,3-diacylglucosamine diphosphatase [Xanthomonadaceae bacterium]MDE1965049.1 UDP-2,3-diacylglucosamine diphosphatase [Xanthomonadaceae bacterium]